MEPNSWDELMARPFYRGLLSFRVAAQPLQGDYGTKRSNPGALTGSDVPDVQREQT
jgi:hypothetical protein